MKFTCDNCGKEYTNPKLASPHMGSYATDSVGRKICYSCCAEIDKQYMDDNGKIYLYLTGHVDMVARHDLGIESLKVTNWPSTLKYQPMTLKKSWAHTPQGYRYPVYHVTFLDHNNKRWYGIMRGSFTELILCKRYK